MVKENPVVSVILPTYNDSKYLSRAIDSILNQTFRDFELIIIDDGSTDDTSDVLNIYDDTRIRILNNEENKGLIYSLNRGIEESQGIYLARMDSDDVSNPRRLECQLAYMENNPDIDLCGTDYMIREGNDVKEIHLVDDSDALFSKLLFQSPLAHSTWFVRKSSLATLRYNEKYYLNEDYKLMLEFFKRGKRIGCVNEVLQIYELRIDSVSHITDTPDSYFQVKKELLNMFRLDFSIKYLRRMRWGRGKINSLFYLFNIPFFFGMIMIRNNKYSVMNKYYLSREIDMEIMKRRI